MSIVCWENHDTVNSLGNIASSFGFAAILMDKVNSQGKDNTQDIDSGEIVVSSIRAGMKREFAMMMKAQSEMGGLPAGGRRVTRSQSTVSSSKGYVRSDDKVSRKVKGSESKKIKKDEGEKLGGEGVKRLDFDVLDGDKGEKRNAPEVVSNVGDDSGDLEAGLVAVERREAEKVGAELREDMPLIIESPLPHVRGTVGDSVHEDERPVGETSDLGYGRNEESTSGLLERPLRRFTRSALKLHDEEMGLGSTAGVVDSGSAVTLTTSPSKLEMKMSKKVELKRIPTKLKDLLETGLLEGLHVRYVHGSKGAGILCSCDECKERTIVTPNQFELHAGSGNKRPPEYIFLDNGKSLRDVLNACKANLSESLESVILNAIGRSNYTTAFCINCKELIPEAGAGRSMLLCDSCVLPKESDPSDAQISETIRRSPLAGSSAPASSSCGPVVPESAPISSDSQPQTKRQGKLTRKDLRMHKSVLAEDVLPEGTALSYVMHGKIRLEGYKKDGAIFCTCCNEVVSPSQFEAHAGFASRRKPYMSIYTSNGVSLHQLSLELSKNRKSSTEENDDLCSICEDGGDLLCCENCPRAFHTECVGISVIPQETWYCKYCQNMFEKEKFSERDANAIAAGRVPGVDPLEDITQRCIRIVGTFEPDIGGCAICRGHDFSNSGFNGRTVIICDQCEKEYHVGCLKEQNIDDLKALPKNEWFCCRKCSNINSALQKLIGDGEQRLPEALSDVLKKKCEGQDPHKNPEPEIRWRLLRGKKGTEDTRVWLSGAVTIFHDRFDPIADASTGRLDLIPHMVYGRQFKDQDFCNMYCAVLMVNSVVVSAGIFRIFGEEVAELPLVATRSECQGKGYFQSLFYCIEGLLASLNVKDLVLPAADEAESLWRNRFGFKKLGQEQLDRYKKSYQMMIFQGTNVLHKSIPKA
ncbi:Increased DNA methylation 1 [Sesamum alatum]|uniref:Increased DNA methylation 1 n=1 Tax=Sesamum alatum TaxID=300844 RepID=A0AAE1Z3K0_9LAMI|nr:Increased DNA methylation 1 [Sesamum alatum]